MGSGKTSVGRRVAVRLGRPFLDSDAHVESLTGRTVREIFEHDGEPAFRLLEAEALADALASSPPAVIAAAGGVVLDPGNRRRLSSGATVIWLRAEPAVLARRVRPGDHRPLLGDDPLVALERMQQERRALYEEVADHAVEVGDRPLHQVVEEVLAVAR